MFFVIDSNYCSKLQIVVSAYHRIKRYPMMTNEIILDKYCLRKHQLSLKSLCLIMLNRCTIDKTSNNEILITFKDKRWDKLAKLITFGNGVVKGSKILSYAFGKGDEII